MSRPIAYVRWALAALFACVSAPAFAADTPVDTDYTLHDFKFHTGEVMPELRVHVTTIGNPKGEPVLILHGTNGSGRSMLAPSFAGVLFGPGQPLDSSRYFIILPDAIGAGHSSKPSDGLHAKFPVYDYADMVQAQYRVVTEALGVHHLRLVIGNSMGGMQTWMWGEAYPGFMDALVPMASQPTEMSSRNWMMRRMYVQSIRDDPAYQGGEYTTQPPSLRLATVMFGIATSGGTLAYQAAAPTGDKADAFVDAQLAAKFTLDANDTIYQWQSSRDYNAAPELEHITAHLLAINSADDERNPPETGTMTRSLKLVKHAGLLLIPASAETRGHGTTMLAHFYAKPLAAFLTAIPHAK